MTGAMTRLLFLSALLFFSSIGLAQECNSDGECDKHERCPVWAEQGQCLRNQEYMGKYCPVSCKGVVKKVLESNPTDKNCNDLHPRCPIWKDLGECQENPQDMNRFCRLSCGKCEDEAAPEEFLCTDRNETCAFWASKGECVANPRFMKVNCAKSCNTCDKTEKKGRNIKATTLSEEAQNLLDWSEKVGVRQSAIGTEAENTILKIKHAKEYWEKEATEALPKDLLDRCRNAHELCSFWAHLGECEKNEAYMATNCGPACGTCNLIDINARCPPLDDPQPGLRPGQLNRMFERIVKNAPGNRTEDSLTDEEKKIPRYTVTVHSRPSEEPATDVDVVNDKSLPPWVITFDNFMTDEECEAMIKIGYKYEYKRSEDVGEEKADGTFGSIQSERRTSENAWCSSHVGCREEEIPALIHKRIANVLQIPANNSEDFQILRYQKNQFYRTHHDYIPHQRDRQCGPRILTFFMYLSDVEKGGGTNFPQLDITVQPKRGRALLWPSVYNADPMTMDPRFYHQALPVEEGVKYAFNGWIHQYDYVTPQAKGCN